MKPARSVALASVLATLAPTALYAQPAPVAPDVSTAAAAFQEGQRAQLAHQFDRAAEFFEIADRAAPSPAALRSAIRCHQSAGHLARAATLCLRVRARDGADAQSMQVADAVLAELSPRLGHITLSSDVACSLAVDRLAASEGESTHHELFVDPGAHTLTATWPHRGTQDRRVTAAAGQTSDISLQSPPEQAIDTPPPPPPPSPPPPPPPLVEAHPPLPPWVFIAGAAATTVSAGVMIWSGLDTLSARDAYVMRPTEAGYLDGAGRETRTNALIATTAVLGLATAAVAVFWTDWHPRRNTPAQTTAPLVGVSDGRWMLGVIRSF